MDRYRPPPRRPSPPAPATGAAPRRPRAPARRVVESAAGPDRAQARAGSRPPARAARAPRAARTRPVPVDPHGLVHPVAGGRVARRSEIPEVAHAVGQVVGELVGFADIEDRGIPVDPDLVVVLLDDRERAALGPFGPHEARSIEDVT